VSFTGPAWSEGTLIGIAHDYEQRTKLRRAPQYTASALV
jgi:Asp-tRNA(Asn)/Glu-tRNA(Gln) amidotransferase A subunit family amidase